MRDATVAQTRGESAACVMSDLWRLTSHFWNITNGYKFQIWDVKDTFGR